jgi:VCBS repeat-containing protein
MLTIGLIVSLVLAAALFVGAQAPSPATAIGQSQGCTPIVTAVTQVNVRYGPSTNYNPPIGTMFPGQSAQVTGRLSDNSWYRIIFNGREGWVSSQYVTTSCMDTVPVVPAPPPPVGPTSSPGNANFQSSNYSLQQGQCATLSWNVQEVAAVYLSDGQYQYPVGGVDTRTVCPTTTTTYTLTVQRRDGSTFQQQLTITVTPAGSSNNPNFRADSYSLSPGQCTTLRWNVNNVRAVYFWDGSNQQGVGGNDSRQVCPNSTTVYRLQVIGNDGSSNDYYQTITVSSNPNAPAVNFTANPTTIAQGQCSTLNWTVSGSYNTIMLLDTSTNSTTVVGPTGNISVCPQNSATYILRVTGTDGRQYDTSVNVNVYYGPTPQP